MSWLKKENDVVEVKELESNSTQISESNAYTAKITECRLAPSKDESSKSVSLCVGIETEDGETAKSFFTLIGRDGKTYYMGQAGSDKVKKQHIGLGIANSLFKIALDKEIFDVEPEEVTYKAYNKEAEEMEEVEGDGFPDMIGKTIGVCVQMVREINGADSRETANIEHFFDADTGLFAGEEEGAKVTKLDKWLRNMKEFREIVKDTPKSAFGRKKEEKKNDEEKPRKSKWGR